MAESLHQDDAASSDESALDEYEILNFPGDVDWSTTAILKCDPSGGPYSEHDVLSAIFSTVMRNQVFNIGPTCINHVYTICMKNEYELSNFVKRAAEHKMKVKGRRCTVENLHTGCVNLCVKWIPLEIDSTHILKELEPYGTVAKTDLIKSRHKGWYHVYTNERRFTLNLNPGVSISDLPYGIFVKGMFGAVSVWERNPKCKECYYVGHKSDYCEYQGCPFDFRRKDE